LGSDGSVTRNFLLSLLFLLQLESHVAIASGVTSCTQGKGCHEPISPAFEALNESKDKLLGALLDLPAVETDPKRGFLKTTPDDPFKREIPDYLFDRVLALAEGDPEVVSLFDLAAKKAGLKNRAELGSFVKICNSGLTTQNSVCVNKDGSLASFYSIVVHELIHYVHFDSMQKGINAKDVLDYKTPNDFVRDALQVRGGELEAYSGHGRAYLRLRGRLGWNDISRKNKFLRLQGFNSLPEETFDNEGNVLHPEHLLANIAKDYSEMYLDIFARRVKSAHAHAKRLHDFYNDLIAKGKSHPSYPPKLKAAAEKLLALEQRFPTLISK